MSSAMGASANRNARIAAQGFACPCCGSVEFQQRKVLWSDLIQAWEIAPHEVDYIDRQQGLRCIACGANLRTMALADALLRALGEGGTLEEFVLTRRARRLRVLEINEAGQLTRHLKRLPHHRLVCYPEADMEALPFGDNAFDLTVHSDTLEHVPDPVQGLRECRRVLKQGGFCLYTVPMIVGRLTRSREGLPPSYHGSPSNPEDCQVFTEYGADAWRHLALAGFSECRIYAFEHPAAHALAGIK